MRHVLRNSFFVLALLVFFAAMVYPPQKNLRLGKDLRGGVTLLYSVKIDRNENSSRVLDQVIQVLKERIDPQGLLEIQIIAQGQDRIEITMPLPGEHVLKLRQEFERSLEGLKQFEITPDEFERAMRLPRNERGAAIEALSRGNDRIRGLMEGAAESFDGAAAARIGLTEAQRGGAPEDVIDQLVAAIADAELAYEAARDGVLSASLSPDAVRKALLLPTDEKFVHDVVTDEYISLGSPRERALAKILSDHPELEDQIRVIEATYNVYVENRKSLDDPEDLKRLVASSGVLSFRISVDPSGTGSQNTHPEEQRLRRELREKGPGGVRSRDARWFEIDRIESWYDTLQEWEALQASPSAFFDNRQFVGEYYEGNYYILLWDTRNTRLTQADGVWGVRSAFQTVDEIGKPAIGFQMDDRGARRLGELTGPNVGNKMAILLDGQLFGAPPVLRSRISSNGIIQGDFTSAEINYVTRVLTAGSLQAKLSPTPLSVNQVAPDLGADNLRMGMQAGIWALIAVSSFMFFYYLIYGSVAVFSLLCNAIIILGAMALARASFSLPGIAGIILTFGMAVDANVLIYERISEELRLGQDLKTAVRLGYQRALSSIVDGNVTNLIVCFVLAYTGTQEIKGFAITLGIGVIATMFSSLVITRLIFAIFTDNLKIKKLTMLPMAVPAIERLLEPRVDWLRLRGVFITISVVLMGLGVTMIVTQGQKMLGTEFRGGIQIDLPLKINAETGEPILRTRQDIEEAVREIGEQVADDNPLRDLRNADVMPLNPQDDGVTSDFFRIKTYATDTDEVQAAVFGVFGSAGEDIIDSRSPLRFTGQQIERAEAAPVRAIDSRRLGEVLGRPEFRDDVRDYLGGVAILLENLSPEPTLDGLNDRLEAMRAREGFSQTLGRTSEVRVLRGTRDSVQSAVVLVFDEDVNVFDNEQVWNAEVRDLEWRLTREALIKTTSLASVQSFSSIVAQDFKGKAIVSVFLSLLLILIYIWVRFGNVRYSVAAILTLTHDILIVIGLIALAEIVYDSPALQPVALKLGIEPFKIDLNLVAAMLTIIGYSLNDTIIIMDRIRENRGKLSYATREVINASINQTISRTVVTSGTTLIAVSILYVYGGPGVHGFAYALLLGVMIGTYSSIAIAAPLVWSRKRVQGEPIGEDVGEDDGSDID